MFELNKPLYMTRTIAEELPKEHKQFLAEFLLNSHDQLTDYLQIFEFYVEDGKQWLIQRQEEPERETTISVDLKFTGPIDRKVWIIDQVDHVIILFPSDY